LIVVCGIVRKNPGIIVCQRKKKPYEGYWEFPGGKLEKGETKRQCLNRELAEELDIRVSVDRFFTTVSYKYDGINIHLFCYLCSYLRGTIRLTEHQSFAVIRYSELLRFKLLEGNVKLAKKLKYLKFIN